MTTDMIHAAQQSWAAGVVHIGTLKNQPAQCKAYTTEFLNQHYAFEHAGGSGILFKPTKATQEPFRPTFAMALSYFIGGPDRACAEDTGFALKPWRQITFSNHQVRIQGAEALAMGHYHFTNTNGLTTKVEYSFAYVLDQGRVKILLQHSSFPYHPVPPPANPFAGLFQRTTTDPDFASCRIVYPNEAAYDNARQISNSYFNKQPLAVAFPRTAYQVSVCVNYCRQNNLQLRLRAGGHQHQGSSSANGALMVRLSDMNAITFCDDLQSAWIEPGIKLGRVYEQLNQKNKLLPAGGCMNVNIGGITQGGGWGLHTRKQGFTCDKLLAAEVVLANGETVTASANENTGLFWAIRGSGGGNFGVVTRFKFALTDMPEQLWVFRFGWRAAAMQQVVATYLEQQANFPNELTSFLRLTVMPQGAPESKEAAQIPASYPVYASGLFYGTSEGLKKVLAQLEQQTNPEASTYELYGSSEISRDEMKALKTALKAFTFTLRPTAESKNTAAAVINNLFGYDTFLDQGQPTGPAPSTCLTAPPKVNCDAPHPHKVTSAYPTNTGPAYYQQVATAVARYINSSQYNQHVRQYCTFHAMGGAISTPPAGGRAYAFTDKEFLLQIQAWWNYPEGHEDACRANHPEQVQYIQWVNHFRQTLASNNLATGAFLNFIDYDMVSNPTTPEGKARLLDQYYGPILGRLQKAKKMYDPGNLFQFEMSIPPAP